MIIEGFKRHAVTSGFGWRSTIGLVAVAVLVGGCSSIPDAANPIKWYENTVEALTGEDDSEEAKAAAQAKPAPGGDKVFPSLSSVPQKPAVTARQEREQVAEGLVADTERRRYASNVTRQGEAKNVLSDKPAKAAPVPPKPQISGAVPTLPVTPAPVSPPKRMAAAPALKPAPMPASPKAPGIALQPPPMPKVADAKPTEVAPRPTKPVMPANSMMPASDGEFETIVISSSGISSGGAVAAPGAKSAPLKFGASSVRPSAGSPRAGTLRIATIQFANGSAGLDARDRSILRNVLALQRERGGVIEVVGHASSRTANMDSVRHKMVNYRISEERAASVARTLLKLGARTNDIVVTAKSDLEPMFFEFMPSGEAGNRRVEVFLTF